MPKFDELFDAECTEMDAQIAAMKSTTTAFQAAVKRKEEDLATTMIEDGADVYSALPGGQSGAGAKVVNTIFAEQKNLGRKTAANLAAKVVIALQP